MQRDKPLKYFMKRRFFLWWCGLLVILSQSSGLAANFSVAVTGLRFSPTNIAINVGDTVTWTGVGISHTVTGNSPSEPFCGTNAPPGGTCSVTFNTPGAFPYRCIPHAGFGMTGLVTVASSAIAPVVTITNPPNNALLAAPATVTIGITATDSDGTVVNVQLLTNGVASVTDSTPPFSITVSNLAAGNYALRARATDSQSLSATSAPVNIRVVNRPVLSFTAGSNGPVELSFNTVAGVSYVVEGSSVLTNFSSIVTNPGNGGALQFSETNGGPQRFYRVRLE